MNEITIGDPSDIVLNITWPPFSMDCPVCFEGLEWSITHFEARHAAEMTFQEWTDTQVKRIAAWRERQE